MSPGDISELANSSELAFRVTFDSEVPTQDQLYWRGLVFNHFDGRRWRPLSPERDKNRDNSWKAYKPSNKPAVIRRGPAVQYTVTIEANKQPWLYALPYAKSPDNGVLPGRDLTLRTVFPLDARFQYRVESYPQSILNPELDAIKRRRALQLPDGYNPRALQFASQLHARSGSDQAYMRAVLQHFNQEAFHYTLKPGQLGRDSIDEFLFDKRRGFCEHYASSFVFLMRAAGVPARVVVGYQGGELNPYEGYLLVHQFDAHAWTEVWFPGEGWQRVDPTAAVAPERVEHGFSEALQEELTENRVLPFGARDIAALQWLRLRWDSVNYSWSKWILNYDADRQMQVLENWLGAVTPWRIAAFILGVSALVIGAVAISLLRQRVKHKLHVIDRHYLRYTRVLQRLGLERAPAEGPDSYAERVEAQYPELGAAARRVAYLYKRMRYELPAGAAHKREDQRKFIEEIRLFAKAAKAVAPVEPLVTGTAADIGA
jgi:transglutaminase-like putative cysteine protease